MHIASTASRIQASMAASAVPNGTYPVQFAPSALTELQGKKNHAPNGDLVAFRCTLGIETPPLT